MLKLNLTLLVTWFFLTAGVWAVDEGSSPLNLLLQASGRQSRCILPPFPAGGEYQIVGSDVRPVPGAVVDDLTILLFSCQANSALEGEATLVCIGGAWIKDPPKCIARINCILPESPTNGKYEIVGSPVQPTPGQEVDQFTAISFSCNPLFDLQGGRTSVCVSGEWSTGVPKCERSSRCLVPDLPERGSYSLVNPSEVAVPGSEVHSSRALQYDCPTPFTLFGESLTTCSDGEWLPKIPECIEILDCSSFAGQPSGVYEIRQYGISKPFPVYCELELLGGNWTIFQQRVDDSVDFYRNYVSYTNGFGVLTGNSWLGLEKIHQLTKNNDQELYVHLEAANGSTAYARFKNFMVGDSSSGFQLTVEDYEGTAGDSLSYHNGMKFSTYDKKQDLSNSNCAVSYHGGYWYNKCYASNLNGRYFTPGVSDVTSVHWYEWMTRRSLKTTRLMFRKKY